MTKTIKTILASYARYPMPGAYVTKMNAQLGSARPQQSRLRNQAASALYFEIPRIFVEFTKTGDLFDYAKVDTRRICVAGEICWQQHVRFSIDLKNMTANAGATTTWDRTRIAGGSSDGLLLHRQFSRFMTTWEDNVSSPGMTIDGSVRTLTATPLAADEPLIVPMDTTDIRRVINDESTYYIPTLASEMWGTIYSDDKTNVDFSGTHPDMRKLCENDAHQTLLERSLQQLVSTEFYRPHDGTPQEYIEGLHARGRGRYFNVNLERQTTVAGL